MKAPGPIFALSLTPSSRFKSHLVNYIRDFVRDKVSMGGPDRPAQEQRGKQRAAALGSLADYIASVPDADPRMFQLAQVARSLPGMRSWQHGEPFEPTITQGKLFYALGGSGTGGLIAPEDTFSELVSAGVADMAALHRANDAELERKVEVAEGRAKEAEARVAPLAQAEADLSAEREKSAAVQAEVDRLQQQVADLEGFLSADGSKPRRVHIGGGDKNVGIYRSLSDGAPVLEVGYPDDKGRQRWKRLAPDASIEDARRVRVRLAGQPHDPEHGGHTDDDLQTTTPEPVAAGGREA